MSQLLLLMLPFSRLDSGPIASIFLTIKTWMMASQRMPEKRWRHRGFQLQWPSNRSMRLSRTNIKGHHVALVRLSALPLLLPTDSVYSRRVNITDNLIR